MNINLMFAAAQLDMGVFNTDYPKHQSSETNIVSESGYIRVGKL